MVVNPPTIVQLLAWIGLNADHKRNSVTSDFLSAPESLAHLVTEYDDDIYSVCHTYQKRLVVI